MILIKGMEMPKSCPCELIGVGYDLFCSFAYGVPARVQEYYECCENGTRPSWCPLVEVPPHGRLIDLDGTALAQYYDEEHEEWSMETVTVEDILWGVCENMPPIVIPGDKDGET